MNLGFSSSKSADSTFLNREQSPFLQDLYGQARSQFNQSLPGITDTTQNLTNQLAPRQELAFNNLIDNQQLGAIGGGQSLGQQTLAGIQGGSANPFIDQMIGNLGQDIGQNLQRNILPGIQSGALLAGQGGSSRQGIAEGIALSDANKQFSSEAARLRGGAFESDQARQLQAAQAFTGNQLGALGQQQAGQLGGIGASQDLFGTALAPQLAQQQALQQYANIIGGPIQDQYGSSRATSFNFGIGGG